MITYYVINTQYKLTVTFTNLAGALVNPLTVLFYARRPNGSTVSLPLDSNPSLGVFVSYWEPDMVGPWKIQVRGVTPDIQTPDQLCTVLSSFIP